MRADYPRGEVGPGSAMTADNVRYDAGGKRVFVGFGSGALAAVDPAAGQCARPGEAGRATRNRSSWSARALGRIVNVPNAEQIAVVDRTAMKVTASMAGDEREIELPDGARRGEPSSVRRLPTARQGRSSTTRRRGGKSAPSTSSATPTTCGTQRRSRKRLYVSGGEGFIDVLQEQDADRFTRLARVPTAAGARTSLFVADQNRLYLAVPHRGGQKAEIRIYETR